MKKIAQLKECIDDETQENQTNRYTSRTNVAETKRKIIPNKNSEQKLIEFSEQNSNILPVQQQLLVQMKQNYSQTGKEEFVDFEFVGKRLTEMHLLKTSLATLQLEQVHEAQGKQNVIHSLMKVLEHLKADYQVLYGSDKALEPKIVEPNSQKLKQITGSNTFTAKKFTNIDEQIKVVQDERDLNAEFCYAVYSTLNQKIRKSLLVVCELMNLFKNKAMFEPGSGVFSQRLLDEHNI